MERLAFEPLAFESSGAVSGDQELAREAAQVELANQLIALKTSGKLSARDVCVLMWWAKHAGLPEGPATAFAFTPATTQTGHFNRHFNVALGMDTDLEGSYNLRVPGPTAVDFDSNAAYVPCLPPHESLEQELADTPGLQDQLAATIANREWSSQHMEHPVVKSARPDEHVWPLGLFCDKVPFQHRDSALVFFLYNLVSGVRHLSIALRSSDLCQCGCHGWCTLFPVMVWLRWSLGAMAKGRWPSERHDGMPFEALDSTRAAMAGEPLAKAALVYILGDWAEISHTWGFPDWSNLFHPCFCCTAVREELDDVGELSAVSPPFPAKDHASYDQACGHCEKVVQVRDAVALARLLGFLDFTAAGYMLTANLPELGLLARDRLAPSTDLPNLDIRCLGDVQSFPVVLTFWRKDNATVAKWRNPLFTELTGISVETFALDVMHCLHLGTWKAFCMTCIWWLLLEDAWGTGATTQHDLVDMGFARFKAELYRWYEQERRRLGQQNVYSVQKFTLRMLGTPTQPTLATKAAETGTLLQWCALKLAELPTARLGQQGTALHEVGRSFRKMAETMKRNPRVFPNSELQRFVDATISAFQNRESAGIPWTPKWHLMLHVAARARVAGNPRFYSTFLDEDYNFRVAKMAAVCHRFTWHNNLLSGFRRSFSDAATRQVRQRTV